MQEILSGPWPWHFWHFMRVPWEKVLPQSPQRWPKHPNRLIPCLFVVFYAIGLCPWPCIWLLDAVLLVAKWLPSSSRSLRLSRWVWNIRLRTCFWFLWVSKIQLIYRADILLPCTSKIHVICRAGILSLEPTTVILFLIPSPHHCFSSFVCYLLPPPPHRNT